MKKNTYLVFLCFLLNTGLIFAQTFPTEGLILHHTFEWPELGDLEFIDQSGNGNSIFINAIDNCPPESDRNENPLSQSVGSTCDLSLNSNYSSPSFENLSKFSCSFWVMKPDFSGPTANSTVIQFIDENKISYEVRIDTDLKVLLQSKNDQLLLGTLNSTFYFPVSQWIHIAFSVNQEDQILRLFINGELMQEVELFLFEMGNPKILFGKEIEPGLPINLLCYDDLFVFNRILDVDEVEALYNYTTPIATDLENTFLAKNRINIFPNPNSNNVLTINTNGINEPFDLTIIDGQGKIIKRINNFSNNTLAIDDLSQGIYTILFSFDKFNVSRRLSVTG